MAWVLSGLIASGAAAIAAPEAVAFASQFTSLPSPQTLATREVSRSTRILDRHGVLLYEFFDQSGPESGRRTVIKIEDLPPAVIQATIATEDATFYQNNGLDYRGILRAIYQNVTGSGESGGSTITQQLARNVFISDEERLNRDPRVRYIRKLKEWVLAVEIAQLFSKDQILEMYLNEIYYGNLSYGIQAAAQGYFGKDAKDLSLPEAALLAGLPQAPSVYNPMVNPRAAKARQEYVLDLMTRQGYITPEQAEAAKNTPLVYKTVNVEIKAPHWVFFVRDQLEKEFGAELLYRGGLTVITTLDYRLQQQAERIARAHIDAIRGNNANNASLVAIDPKTGEILVMVGSVDYFDKSIDGQVNIALSDRQPGSSIKPITYAAAFR
ncbi:MAG: transglycosylase domain-containing protein, partial [Dehalococcoidia bacterium]|nr:transglycosylase domain-containing protein [Dehalococcoidia bacterium]